MWDKDRQKWFVLEMSDMHRYKNDFERRKLVAAGLGLLPDQIEFKVIRPGEGRKPGSVFT